MLKVKSRKTKWGFRGYVEYWEESDFALSLRYNHKPYKVWSEVAGPHRITKEDALEDANRLKDDREYLYS